MPETTGQFAKFRSAGTPDQLAALLRDPSPAQAQELARGLGEARFHRLRQLAAEVEPTRGRTDDRPPVVVLAGIMGTELSVTEFDGEPELLWVHRGRIARRGLDELRLDRDGRAPDGGTGVAAVTPTHLMSEYYAELVLYLARDHRVLPFPYDWRLSIESAAQRLEGEIRAAFGGAAVAVVAHSMGGLVARAMIARNPRDASGNPLVRRLVMLGTPNGGSFEVPLILTGIQDTVRKLKYLAYPLTAAWGGAEAALQKVLAIINTFPSVYQMLPVRGTNFDKLYLPKTYEKQNRGVSGEHIKAAKKFQELIAGAVDPERMVYVAGYGWPTVVGVNAPDDLGTFASYEVNALGDGKVPHALGPLPGVTTFYAPVEHADLARDPLVLSGLPELVATGTTRALPLTLPVEKESTRAGARRGQDLTRDWAGRMAEKAATDEETFRRLVTGAGRGVPTTDEADAEFRSQVLRGFVSPGTRLPPPKRKRGDIPHLTIEVFQCNIADVHDPKKRAHDPADPAGTKELRPAIDAVSVGMYSGPQAIWGAIRDLDESIDDWSDAEAKKTAAAAGEEEPKRVELRYLTDVIERGLVRGDLGVPSLIADPRPGGRDLVLVGMGTHGQFGLPEVQILARELGWFLGRQGKRHLATMLVGAGIGHLSVAEALPAFLSGLADALNEPGAVPSRLQRVTFAEWYGERVRELDTALVKAVDQMKDRLRIGYTPLPENLLQTFDQRGRARRAAAAALTAPVADPRPNRMTVDRTGRTYIYSAVTTEAAVPERRHEIDPLLIDECNAQLLAATTREAQEAEGASLARRAIPRDFRPQFASAAPLLLEVTADTAQLHWELVILSSAGRPNERSEPLGLARGLTRQLRTRFAPAPQALPSQTRALRVLVVADPADDARLPGAEREGQEVAELFETFNRFARPDGARVEVTRLLGPGFATRRRVLSELDTGYDVVHYAGHAFYDTNAPADSGLLFNNGTNGRPREVLTARELRTLDTVPRFVFLNACESGKTDARPEARTAAVAPSFAEAFFEQGVADFICTGWPVGDTAARLFARLLYADLLGLEVVLDGDAARVTGVPKAPTALFEALRGARRTVAAHPTGLRTWGAYQHYGNPFTRFFPTDLKRLNHGEPTPSVTTAARPPAPLPRVAAAGAPEPGTAPVGPAAGADTTKKGDKLKLVRQALRERETELLRLPTVVSVRAGFRYATDKTDPKRGSWSTGEWALIVSVDELKDPGKLDPSEAVPDKILVLDEHGHAQPVPVEVVPASLEEWRRVSADTRGGPSLPLEPLALPGEESRVLPPDAERALAAYTPPPNAKLDPVNDQMKITLHVSPDTGWPTLSAFLAGTQRSMTVAMYDFTAPHVLAAFLKHMRPKKVQAVALVLDPAQALSHGAGGDNPKKDDVEETSVRDQLEQALGDRFRFAWAAVKRAGKVAQGIFPRAYHTKVAVRDGEAFWLSSGNWQSTNQPPLSVVSDDPEADVDVSVWGQYNREWHVVVEHPGLAKTFQAFIEHDLNCALPLQEARGPVAAEGEQEVLVPLPPAPDEVTWFEPLVLDKRVAVTPVLTPDNYADVVVPLIESATKTLYFQNQYISVGPAIPEAFDRLLKALVEKAKRLKDGFRMILRDIGDVRLMLEKLEELGFDMQTQVRVQPATHTKGIIVDSKRVLVGSHNWSALGVTRNRDASLLIDDPQAARYFEQIFLHDWKNLARKKLRNKRLPLRLVSPADRGAVTPDGYTRMSLADYLDD